MELDSVEADRQILATLQRNLPAGLAPTARRWRCSITCDFYRDVLFHAEYGTMIHSGHSAEHPGSEAKHEVTAWLEKQGCGQGYDQLPTARLADLTPALLGRADPDGILSQNAGW